MLAHYLNYYISYLQILYLAENKIKNEKSQFELMLMRTVFVEKYLFKEENLLLSVAVL